LKRELDKMKELVTRRHQKGLKMDLVKVRAHTGVYGNECADIMANAAREGDDWRAALVAQDPNTTTTRARGRCPNPRFGFFASHTASFALVALANAISATVSSQLTTATGAKDSIWRRLVDVYDLLPGAESGDTNFCGICQCRGASPQKLTTCELYTIGLIAKGPQCSLVTDTQVHRHVWRNVYI
jgi:hypothetical protein